MVDWSKIPDLAAVTLLAAAFASIARRSSSQISGLWLTGWMMIALHFAALMFAPLGGRSGAVAGFIGLAALVWAGVLFMWASVPYRSKQRSSRWILLAMLLTNTAYIGVITFIPADWGALDAAAVLLGLLPLLLMLLTIRRFNHPLRWVLVIIYNSLAIGLLLFQNRPGNGTDLALNAVLFAVYFACSIHFWFNYRRASTGAFITIAGFLAWAAVFVVAPGMSAFLPHVHFESEVWNLPKYVVAVGMILLLLEDQIAHNKHLALHDELTGLPNRRLFQDRLTSSLERARRSGAKTALLLLDLDRFKQVNDSLGHHAGDLLLQHVGALLSGRVRRSDTVARTGGDEFSIILDEPVSREDAECVGQSLMQLIEEPLELDGHTVQIGASVGIAIFPDDALTADALCVAADFRMYACKAGDTQSPQPCSSRPAEVSNPAD